MTGYPLHVRLAGQDWVISGTPSEVTAELVERQDPPGGMVIWSRRMEIFQRCQSDLAWFERPALLRSARPFRIRQCGVTKLALWRW